MVFFYENPNPETTFFVYVKLLISLLNGALFRLGENFSVRGYGARFSAADHQQLFKLMVGTPTARCAQPVWGTTTMATMTKTMITMTTTQKKDKTRAKKRSELSKAD